MVTILDYLPVPDLIRFARVSKRMQEMVYDDTRWIQKLNAMGAWNETEARQRTEEAMKRRLEAQRTRDADEARRTGVGLAGSVNGIAGGGRERGGSFTIFDAHVEEERYKKSLEQPRPRPRHGSVADGFDDLTLSSKPLPDPAIALTALRQVKSIRGFARQEYGKIHGALAPFYNDIAHAESSSDPIIFRTYRDPEQQAQILADLRIFARCDSAQGWQQREQKLETMTGIFENAALLEFQHGYEVQDIDRMKRYAHVLVILNGGTTAIDIFIHNHPYMLKKEQLGNPLDCVDGVAYGHCDLGPSHRFFDRLAGMLSEQSPIIDRVFPLTVDVLHPFLSRVCEDIIAEFLNSLFDEAHSKNIETYLKAVSGVFEQAMRFAASVKPIKASKPDFPQEVVNMVTKCFEPHIDLYLTEELDFFRTKAETEVRAWEKQLSEEEARTESFFMSNVNRQAAKRDFLTSFKKVVMMPVNVLPTFPSTNRSVSATQKASIEEGSRPSTPSTPNSASGSEAPTTELAAKTAIMNSRLEGIKSLFSIEVAINLIHYAKSSLERAAIVVRMGRPFGDKAKEQCEAIFVTLLSILGQRHIRTGFDKAVGHLSNYNPREVKQLRGDVSGTHDSPAGVEPLVTFLELVNVGDLIQQMVDVFYAQELVATKLTDRDDFLALAGKEKKRFEQMLDERVAAGMSKGIDVLMDEVEYICATTQQATDFNPLPLPSEKGNAMAGIVDIGMSETAKKVVATIDSHTGMLVGSTDKNMLDVFNQEVGLRLFGVLCKHIKRQRISVDGAIKLIRYVLASPHPHPPQMSQTTVTDTAPATSTTTPLS